MQSDESFDLLGEVVFDSENRPVRLMRADGVTFRYYIGPDAHGFILDDGSGEYLMVGSEKRWWRGIIETIADTVIPDTVPDFSLLAIKPDAFQRKLDNLIRSLIRDSGLTVVREKAVGLNKEQLFRLYPYFFEPNWEAALIRYFCSTTTLFLLVTGENAVHKGLEIRNRVRSDFRNADDHPVINLIHSPDTKEEAYREALIFFEKEDIINAIGSRRGRCG